jgi:hypothetical protein
MSHFCNSVLLFLFRGARLPSVQFYAPFHAGDSFITARNVIYNKENVKGHEIGHLQDGIIHYMNFSL